MNSQEIGETLERAGSKFHGLLAAVESCLRGHAELDLEGVKRILKEGQVDVNKSLEKLVREEGFIPSWEWNP